MQRILLTLLRGMWKNCSVLELLKVLTHKLLINYSDKFFKKTSILLLEPYRNQSIFRTRYHLTVLHMKTSHYQEESLNIPRGNYIFWHMRIKPMKPYAHQTWHGEDTPWWDFVHIVIWHVHGNLTNHMTNLKHHYCHNIYDWVVIYYSRLLFI